jgi:hypothetical protein
MLHNGAMFLQDAVGFSEVAVRLTGGDGSSSVVTT